MIPSATEPDWSREEPRGVWDPGRKLIRAVRDYQKGGAMRRRIAVLRHRFWSVVSGADIHPMSVIGPNCILFQQVTLGVSGNGSGVPRLGGNVRIGPGARILGPVKVGDNAVIGANAVVLQDVPTGAVAVGVPARIHTDKGAS